MTLLLGVQSRRRRRRGCSGKVVFRGWFGLGTGTAGGEPGERGGGGGAVAGEEEVGAADEGAECDEARAEDAEELLGGGPVGVFH